MTTSTFRKTFPAQLRICFEMRRLRIAMQCRRPMGPDFPSMSANLGRNLRERRIGLIQAVLEKL